MSSATILYYFLNDYLFLHGHYLPEKHKWKRYNPESILQYHFWDSLSYFPIDPVHHCCHYIAQQLLPSKDNSKFFS